GGENHRALVLWLAPLQRGLVAARRPPRGRDRTCREPSAVGLIRDSCRVEDQGTAVPEVTSQSGRHQEEVWGVGRDAACAIENGLQARGLHDPTLLSRDPECQGGEDP